MAPDYAFEEQARADGARVICGVDEVGRGPLAGPVVAAAAILPPDLPEALLNRLNDSKKLTAKAREDIFGQLIDVVDYGVGRAEPEEIDRINILQASLTAMVRAIGELSAAPDYALVDGNRLPRDLPCKGLPVVKGDSRSLSIAAASIIAKVIRDREMAALAEAHPHYGWERNAGYGTAEHRAAIATHGLTSAHRRSFAGCR
ncbi:MAG: ribonuclease HII [Alphaproteobacteria bacterium]|nr:ribonuclease HII [Alphaproteobacteria bacterium SS10]